jgi:uncharacterized repeat protein (TIGR01451 family)
MTSHPRVAAQPAAHPSSSAASASPRVSPSATASGRLASPPPVIPFARHDLTIVKTADTAVTSAGATVHFTITVTDTGLSTFSPANMTDDLTSTLGDAVYNNNAFATSGTVSFTSPNLAWSGKLASGASATITYSVTVRNPDTGSGVLTNMVTSTSPGSDCPNGGSDPLCTTTVTVSALTIVKTAAVSTTTPGATVGYTITVTNPGRATNTGATFTDPLTGALDDASYNGDATATAGTATFSSPNLTWTGSLASGASATITYSMTVRNPDPGNGILSNTITSATPGSNCPSGGTDTRCAVTVRVAVLTIVKTAGASGTAPGGTVGYTITVTNAGQTAYTGATVTDPLSDVIDDATYGGGASATTGTVSFTSPNLTWTGNLNVGASATITYSVTVNNPDTGNHSLSNTVTSATAGSNCASGSADARCTVAVGVAGLRIVKTADVSTVAPGAKVHYTITVTNTGSATVTGAAFTDPLTSVTDDATYDANVSATAGTPSYTAPDLTWTGNLAAGAAATITYSVTVGSPDPGDGVLSNTVTSATAGSNCPSGNADTRCTATVTVPRLTIAKSASVSTTSPGATVGYTITVTNSGPIGYTGASFSDPLDGVLDDAVLGSGASATAGVVSFNSPDLTWTGNLGVGASATITYSVTVRSPDTGDKVLTNTVVSATPGSTCPAGGTDPNCSVTVPDLAPVLDIVTSASTPTTTPGGVVGYTIVVTNTGPVAYTGATFTDPLADVLDDATYNNNVGFTSGSATVASQNLIWTGDLALGGSATITFSVTVSKPDTGNAVLSSTVTSVTAGSNCPAGSIDPECATKVNVAQLAIVNTANVSTTTPGGVVRYTATFTNTGTVPYTGITIIAGAAEVLDDAVPNGDQTATSGTLTLTSTEVSWTGSLPVGGTVTVTGTITVKSPDTGDKALTSVLTTAAPGSNCPTGSSDPLCTVTVTVLIPALTIAKTADVSTTSPGAVVHYTVTVTDSGLTPYTGASYTDQMDGVLDDATWRGDAAATSGTLSFTSPDLIWTGNLAAGTSATITYSVTVKNPDTGDRVLSNSVVSATAGSNCPASGGSDTRCRAIVTDLVPALDIVKRADTTTATPGSVVHYTVTVTNTGGTAYTGATFTDDLSGTLDEAAYGGDATVTVGPGSVSYTNPDLTWTGNLETGTSATITYSVIVNNPETGDLVLVNTIISATAGNNCPAGGADPDCTARVTVVGATTLTFTKTASVAAATAGSTVTYTIKVANSGLSQYTGASFTDDLTSVIDDAAYDDNATPSSGITWTSPDLNWSGNVPASATVTITYSVTVHTPDAGDKILTNTLTSTSPESNCLADRADPRCATTVPIAELRITNTAGTATATPGADVHYTLTATNTGTAPISAAAFGADFTGVGDDGSYNGDAATTSGAISLDFATSSVIWTGDLAPGAAATVTGSVTINNPDTGDKILTETATSATPGNNCPVRSADPRCTSTVDVLVPALTITKTADSTAVLPGATVTYTTVIANTGDTPYTTATVTDDLTGLLDEAAYNADATATFGAISYASGILTWTGGLGVGASVTITYTVSVNSPGTGGKLLTNTATSTDPGSTCPPANPMPNCTAAVTVRTPALTITKTASSATTLPGATVTYTITVTNTGQTSYTGASFTDDLTGLLDEADYGTDATVTTGPGGVTYARPDLTWTGDLAAGDFATVTYSVTVHSSISGDGTLVNTVSSPTPGSNCPDGSADPGCTATVRVAQLTILTTANVATTTPGGVVQYTITATNTGQVEILDANFTAHFADVFDEATYNNDVSATSGNLTPNPADVSLTWDGNLAPGASAVVSGSVTVNDPGTSDRTLNGNVTSTTPGNNCPAGGADPACSSTVTIVPGELSISVLPSVALGPTGPGGATNGGLGTVQISDDRDLTNSSWTVTVSSTDFTTGNGTPAETIPAGDATYFINALGVTTGSATFTPTPVTVLSGTAQQIVTASNATGDTTADWDPAIQVTVPAAAVAGTYTATITHSVS